MKFIFIIGIHILSLSSVVFGQGENTIIDEDDYNNANIFYENAKAAYEMENYAGAANWFTKAIELNPNNSDYFFGRAVSQVERNKLDLAIMDIELAMSLEKDQPDYHFQAGSIYFKAEKYVEGAKHYGLSAQHQGNNDVYINIQKALFNRGVCYLMYQDYAAALRDFDVVIKDDKENGDAYYNRGVAYLKLSKTQEACKDFEAALSLDIHKASNHIKTTCQ
jgi:tetratricopeptide (TPR) repeat protein